MCHSNNFIILNSFRDYICLHCNNGKVLHAVKKKEKNNVKDVKRFD